jgi:hypothetical protein
MVRLVEIPLSSNMWLWLVVVALVVTLIVSAIVAYKIHGTRRLVMLKKLALKSMRTLPAWREIRRKRAHHEATDPQDR